MRAWLVAAALLILPLLVYWPTISYEYGFRDDYAHLREVRERPGWITTLTSANGRPIYGALLEASLRDIYAVPELKTLRLGATVLIGLVGVLLWWQLRRSGWTEAQAAALGAAATLLPGAQIVVGMGHHLADRVRPRGGPRRVCARRAQFRQSGPPPCRIRFGGLRVVCRYGAQLSDERVVRCDAARGVATDAPPGGAERCEVGHRSSGLLFVSLVAALLVAEVSYYRDRAERSGANAARAAPVHQIAVVPPQPAAELDRTVRASR